METDKEQIDRFQEAARQLGCDEDEVAFDAKLAEIAKKKPVAKEKTQNRDTAK